MKKTLILTLIGLLVLALSVGAFAAEKLLYSATGDNGYYNDGSTENSGGGSEANKAGEWRSNDNRSWRMNQNMDGTNGKFVHWSIIDLDKNDSKSSGINPGEDMYIELVPVAGKLNITADEYKGITLRVKLLSVQSTSAAKRSYDPDFTVSIQVNGSDEWQSGTGKIKIASETASNGFSTVSGGVDMFGVAYYIETNNLKALLSAGDKITGVRIYPYGTGLAKRGDTLRIDTIQIVGYDEYTEPGENAEMLDIDIAFVRKSVAAEMKRAAEVVWKTNTAINYKASNAVGNLSYKTGVQLRGLMYTSGGYNVGTPDELIANLDKDGNYIDADKATLQTAIGSVCSTAIKVASSRFMDTYFSYTAEMVATAGKENGYELLGDLEKYNIKGGTAEEIVTKINDKNTVFKGYAELDVGDFIISNDHTRLAASRATVVYNGSEIDGAKSYVLFTENAGTIKKYTDSMTRDIYYTSWRVEMAYTFDELYEKFYLPYTFTVYKTGKVEAPVVALYNGDDYKKVSARGFYGVAASNYNFINLTATVYDSDNNVVYTQTKYSCRTAFSMYNDFKEVNNSILKDKNRKTYRYVVTAQLGPITKEGEELKTYTLLDISPAEQPAVTTAADTTSAETSAAVTTSAAQAAEKEGLGTGAIIAIIAALVAVGVAVVLVVRKKKK